jgi:cytochrome oxidase Cu insertion factor (SCO1/SenC/PrrC family)
MKLSTLLTIAFMSAAPCASQGEEPAAAYKITLPQKLGTVNFNGLIVHTGKPIDDAYTKKHFQGKKLAIYFGFPDCDWFCPPSASAIMTAAQDHKDIQFIFIASETGYTGEDMKKWLESFKGQDVKAIGITGEVDQLSALHKSMRVHDERGNHLPLVIFVNEQGAVAGSAFTIKPAPVKGEKPLPDPASVQAGITKFFPKAEALKPAPQ